MLAELLLRLFETREANRRLLVETVLDPLKQQLLELHDAYLSNFHQYREQILDSGQSESLAREIERDLDSILALRADVVQQVSQLVRIADSRSPKHKTDIDALYRAVLHYLDLSPEVMQAEQNRVIYFPNPSYNRLRLQVGDRKVENATVVRFLDDLIRARRAKLLALLRTYSELRSVLLS